MQRHIPDPVTTFLPRYTGRYFSQTLFNWLSATFRGESISPNEHVVDQLERALVMEELNKTYCQILRKFRDDNPNGQHPTSTKLAEDELFQIRKNGLAGLEQTRFVAITTSPDSFEYLYTKVCPFNHDSYDSPPYPKKDSYWAYEAKGAFIMQDFDAGEVKLRLGLINFGPSTPLQR